MPRSFRPVIPGQPLHLVQRGNNRMATFSRSADYRYYLRLLGETSQDFGCAIHAYVLMSNVHLLATPDAERGPARMREPGAYPWSSFQCNARGEIDALVTPHPVYLALAAQPADAYLGLIKERIGTEVLDAIRQASRSKAVLGDECFRERVEAVLRRRLMSVPHGGDRRSATFRRARQPLPTTPTP